MVFDASFVHFLKSYKYFEALLSLVECLVWDQDAAGSSPVTSTICKTA